MAVLLIIDVQAGFVNEATRHIPALVERLQHKFDRVFVSRFENPEDSPFRALKDLARFTLGAPEAVLAFSPRPDATLMVKHGYSAASPEVIAASKAAGNAIYLCGIATDNCVLKTAVDLFEAGIRPMIVTDACASHGGARYHEAGLMLLARLIGEKQLVASHDLMLR